MNKLALLLLVVFLAACGGVDSPTGKSTTGGTNTQSGEKATFLLQVIEPKSTALTAPGPGVPAFETWRRVVITHPNLGGIPYKTYRDFNLAGPADPLAFTLPIANGYLVEVLDYYKDKLIFSNYTRVTIESTVLRNNTPFRKVSTAIIRTPMPGTTTSLPKYRIKGYGSTNLDLTGTVTKPVTMSLVTAAQAPALTLSGSRTGTASVPSSIYRYGFGNLSTATFSVFAQFTTPRVFNRTNWSLVRVAQPVTALPATAAAALDQAGGQLVAGGSIAGLYGPYAMESGLFNQHYMARFYVNSNLILLDQNETLDKFVFPGVKYSAPVVVNAVTGTINIPAY